jgi:archaemetzincin
MGPVQPGDWLNSHPERGQTFEEYLQCSPIRPTQDRRTIYIQPLGDFTKGQRKVVERTAEFISLYFNLPVKIKKDIPLSVVPAEARRLHPSWVDENKNRIPQILTHYVMDDILLPSLPDDAVSYIAFTSSDLWPGPDWNFVFGQANLVRRVGVWSIYRFGDPDGGEAEFRKTLLRTMKTGTHELGHMFTMLHCIAYECNMCGSNSLPESDRRPLWLCPECVCKVCWATGTDIVARYRSLAKFCKANGFEREQEFYEKSIRELMGSE